ncbi:sialate O-acetylesterase [Flavobacterium fluviatile]|uniref:sialate O-acetylesterase n=1 Tax=Flavobacterium fluviatile TaxID=1862387 RepID=UPI0013CF5BC3|nr:sialate O-acetylesterase [Flavobacterium fluviatile]
MKLSVYTLLIVVSLVVSPLHPHNSKELIQVVLLGGQSNMAGHGQYEALSTTDKQRIDKIADRLLASIKDNDPTPLSYAEGKSHVKNFGPELFLGVELAE